MRLAKRVRMRRRLRRKRAAREKRRAHSRSRVFTSQYIKIKVSRGVLFSARLLTSTV